MATCYMRQLETHLIHFGPMMLISISKRSQSKVKNAGKFNRKDIRSKWDSWKLKEKHYLAGTAQDKWKINKIRNAKIKEY